MEEVLSNRDLLAEIAAAQLRNLTFRAVCKDWKAILEDLWTQEAEPNQLRFISMLFRNKPRYRFNRINDYNPLNWSHGCTINPALSVAENMMNAVDEYYWDRHIFDIFRHPAMKADLLAKFHSIVSGFQTSDIFIARGLSVNPALTWKDILEHTEIPWQWGAMSQ